MAVIDDPTVQKAMRKALVPMRREKCERRPHEGGQWWLVQSLRADATVEKLAKDTAVEVYYPKLRIMVTPPRDRLSKLQRKNAHMFARPVEKPVFPGYPFARFDWSKDGWREIFRHAGIQGIAWHEGKPCPVLDSYIAKFKSLEVKGAIPGDVDVQTLFGFQVGEEVRVMTGPFAGWNGTIERLDESERVRLLLAVFGRSTPTDLTVDDIEKL